MAENRWHSRHPILFGIICAAAGAPIGASANYFYPKIGNWLLSYPTPIATTPEEILHWFKSIPNEANAQLLAKQLYLGEYIRLSGKIREIGASANSPSSTIQVGSVVVFCTPEIASTFGIGDEVQVLGKVGAICAGGSAIQIYYGWIFHTTVKNSGKKA